MTTLHFRDYGIKMARQPLYYEPVATWLRGDESSAGKKTQQQGEPGYVIATGIAFIAGQDKIDQN